jgi:hypothetical protein
MKHSPKVVSRLPGRSQKAVQDTVAGCREFAAADLARASLMDTTNGRRRLESSALSWTSRAEMIQRLDDSFDARQVIARAEWEDGEAVPEGRDNPNMGAAS